MPLKKSKVESSLQIKGFRIDNKKDHNYFLYYSISGKKTRILTKTSHSRYPDIDDYLVSKMAKQCHLSKVDFENLINCPLDRDQYENILIEKGFIE